MMEKAFFRAYHEVFDDDGNVTICGREKCKKLIRLAKEVTPIYGDEESGMMKTDTIKALYEELFPNGYTEE